MTLYLLIALGVYLSACYAYGIYVLYRVAKTKTIVRPTSQMDKSELARVARSQLPEQGAPKQEEDARVTA